jgi:hypothetical protein
MLVLALDLSTKTGFALLKKEGEAIVLLESGSWALGSTIESHGEYPLGFILAAEKVGAMALELVERFKPEVVVIEETNPGRAGRYTQKFIEWMHLSVLGQLRVAGLERVKYVSTSEWRGKTLKLSVATAKKLAKPFLKQYQELERQLKSLPKKSPEKKSLEEQRVALKKDLQYRCIFGKVDKKSISVAYVNATYGKNLKKGQNDEADAICLGTAYLMGAQTMTNKTIFNHETERQ